MIEQVGEGPPSLGRAEKVGVARDSALFLGRFVQHQKGDARTGRQAVVN